MSSMPADKRLRLRGPRHNLLMQVVDFVWICLSVAVVVSFYPRAASAAMLHDSIAAVAGVLFYLAASAHGLYQTQWLRRAAVDEVKTILMCWLWVVAPLMLLGFATKVLSHFSRVATVSWILLAPALMILCRMLARVSAWTRRPLARRAAIAGVTAFGEQIADSIRRSPELGLSVVGVFDDRSTARDDGPKGDTPSAGTFAQLLAAARDGAVDVVYIALPLRAERRVQELILRLQDTTASVYVAFDFASLVGSGVQQIATVGNLPVLPLLAGAQRSVRTHALTLVRNVGHNLSRRRRARQRPVFRASTPRPLRPVSRDSRANRPGPGVVR